MGQNIFSQSFSTIFWPAIFREISPDNFALLDYFPFSLIKDTEELKKLRQTYIKIDVLRDV